MTTLVIITTYQRQGYLYELLPHVVGKGRTVWVVDDGSSPGSRAIPGAEVWWRPHHGRETYGDLVRWAWGKAVTQSAERICMIPDDVLPAVDDPFGQMESVWQEVARADPHALCLNTLVDRRGHIRQWKSHYPVKVTPRAWMTGWNDLCLYADKEQFLAATGRKRFEAPDTATRGSGVGSQMSRRLRLKGNLYQVDETIWHHRQGPSVMNPDERRRNPL